jgi:hypothetical protein
MNDDALTRWKASLAVLGVAFGKGITGPLTNVYWEGTKDIDIDVFEQAAKRIALADRMFPRIARLRQAADEITATHQEHRLLSAGTPERAAGPYCASCDDTGLAKHVCTEYEPCKWCRAKGLPTCGERYRTPCACRKDNPEIKRRREIERGHRKYAYPSDERYPRPHRI